MKIKINLVNLVISTLLIATINSSCEKKFLELKNPQTLDLESGITDLKTLTAATVGVYNQFQTSSYYNRSFIVIPELIGDNCFISIKNYGRYTSIDNFAVGSGDGYVLGVWAAAYRVIVNANLAISAAESLSLSPDKQVAANQLIGEMYACRALAYFDLIRFFAQPYNFTDDASHDGVPLITKAVEEIIAPSRASVSEVYHSIESDLVTAIGLMLPAKKDGAFSKPAAQALLSKVYLYMEKWGDAEIYASKVIEEGPYILLSNVDYVNSWSASFSTESIFEISNTSTDNSGSNGIGYMTEPAGYGSLLATKDLYDIYSSTDVRRELIEPANRPGGETVAYYGRKYPKGAVSKDDNIKVLRLSEIYLIRAEARAEEENFDDAQADLDVIMQRADPGVAPVTLTGDALVKRIIEERRKELAFEGNRLFDLNRKKMDVNHIQSGLSRMFTYPNEQFIMPIPNAERTANPSVSQNPGWVD